MGLGKGTSLASNKQMLESIPNELLISGRDGRWRLMSAFLQSDRLGKERIWNNSFLNDKSSEDEKSSLEMEELMDIGQRKDR